MFAYVKNEKIIAVSETRMMRRKDAFYDHESETVVPAVPGLVFDEEIETEIEWELEFVDGEIRTVVKDAEEPEPITE